MFQMKSIILLAVVGMAIAMRDQSIAVRGKLICGSKPASNVRVKLWEEDSGTGFHVHSFGPISKDYYLNYIITVEAANSKGPDPDDLLDQGYTDANGEFHLQGGTAELTPIDPVFKVYHDCDDGIKPGSRKVKFALPKSYITHGKTPKKTFDIGEFK
ncbi:Transthyretin-like family protein [Cooperia oncophora]